jgi:hypothetical protein
MRLRKLIVLGALAIFVGGISSCSKKTDNATTDTTTVPTATAPATPPPPPPPPMPDTTVMKKDTVASPAMNADKKEMKKTMKKEKK